MTAMTSTFDVRTTAGRFRTIALLEAVTWAGLLIGMYFKHLASSTTEIGVKIFGMAHGIAFIAFVIAALFAGILYKWTISTWLLALLASILPLATVIFLIWADRTAKLGETSAASGGSAPVGSLPESP